MMTAARDNTRMELLTSGLADWVHLGEIHYQVQQDNPGFTVEQVQRETLKPSDHQCPMASSRLAT
jgi:hypothetical protein